MPWFKLHKHSWKEIARTVVKPMRVRQGSVESCSEDFAIRMVEENRRMASGSTTLLWECQDPDCQKTKQETMLGCPPESAT